MKLTRKKVFVCTLVLNSVALVMAQVGFQLFPEDKITVLSAHITSTVVIISAFFIAQECCEG